MLVRKIIHVDMDAFYASIEQRDNPRLRGLPVIVGGLPGSRGVVSTASYEARKYGVHSAMPSSRAKRLCPHGVFLPVRMDAYCAESEKIREIFHEHTDLVEPLSLDEAYLDVTRNKKNIPSATWIAREIQETIYERTGLTASAGVSFNMFLAKVASGFRKPGGLTVITPAEADAFIDKLDIGEFFGIGRVTAERFRALGVRNGLDLKNMPLADLAENFGKSGLYYHNIARGVDDRMVTPNQPRKSLGRETTFQTDIDRMDEIMRIMDELAAEVEELLKEEGLSGRTVVVKVRYDDFTSITRQRSFDSQVSSRGDILAAAADLLKKTEAGRRKIRLLGVTVTGFPTPEAEDDGPVQLTFPF